MKMWRLISMIRILGIVVSVAALGVAASGQHHDKHDSRALKEDPRLAPGQLAPVLEGLGDHYHAVTTSSKRAQLFFDQGLKLTYGFNHKEALRAFKEAARLDPDCAMAYWGWALVLGPNLNLPMMEDVVEQAYEAIQLAVSKASKVSEQEQDYIEALALRYSDDTKADRGTLDAAYAKVMAELYGKYPNDNDAGTLYAASLMNMSPWNYWTKDKQPRKNTVTFLSTLEEVIKRDPSHEGALHYYIHAIEPVDPDRGEKIADALSGLAPGAGHLVHMPSHIWMQLGRYEDSFAANAKASLADEEYITQCNAQGIYPLGYYPHNVHFLAWAAIMQGNSKSAIESSRKVASKVPQNLEGNYWGLYQTFLSMPLYTLVRFGQWEAILQEPRPEKGLIYLKGIWHYARGMAYTHSGKIEAANAELAKVAGISNDPGYEQEKMGFAKARKLLTIARETLAGDLAAKEGNYEKALSHLERAVRLEGSLTYNEPPDWYYSVRHSLGAALLEAGYPEEAEVVYWEDLRKYRENGYSLYGLWQSLQAQNRIEEADGIKERFQIAWKHADVELASSRF